jgi:hypothetical protein
LMPRTYRTDARWPYSRRKQPEDGAIFIIWLPTQRLPNEIKNPGR